MKQFEIYRDMRRSATIFGLSVAGFASLMGSVILSLLVIIFSFNLGLLCFLLVWNLGLYVGLLQAGSLHLPLETSSYPSLISNKKNAPWV